MVFNRGSARSDTNLILLIKLNAVFCIRQLNYCTGVPRATGMLSWGSASAKRLKTTGLGGGHIAKLCRVYGICFLLYRVRTQNGKAAHPAHRKRRLLHPPMAVHLVDGNVISMLIKFMAWFKTDDHLP